MEWDNVGYKYDFCFTLLEQTKEKGVDINQQHNPDLSFTSIVHHRKVNQKGKGNANAFMI